MSYTNFDRHEFMTAETRTEIMEVIRELRDNDHSRNLENMMYGLYPADDIYQSIAIVLLANL